MPFYTNATEWGEIPQGGLNGTGDGYGARRTPSECVRACGGGIHRLKCLWRNKCWGRIGGFVGLLAGLAGTGEFRGAALPLHCLFAGAQQSLPLHRFCAKHGCAACLPRAVPLSPPTQRPSSFCWPNSAR